MVARNFITVPGEAFSASGAGAVERTVDDKLRDVVSVKDFGAVGDGVADDTAAIQAAIDYCRSNKNHLEFPAGEYKTTSALDWTSWSGISVRGCGPGARSITSGNAQSVIVATGVSDVAHDFSGSAYGTIQGLGFAISGGSVTANVLLARLTGGTFATDYGSDLTFSDCNFASGSVAAIIGHMAEVITLSGCRVNCRGAAGYVATWRAGSAPWAISSPFGKTFTGEVTLTALRFIGGEFTGDNSSEIVLDMGSAPTSGGDVGIFGTYFATSGSNCAAIEVRGVWENVSISGVRCEETSIGTGNRFIYLNSGEMRDWSVTARASGTGPCVGGNGSIFGGTIVTAGAINLQGIIRGVMYSTINPLNWTVVGDVIDSIALSNGVGTLSVSGTNNLQLGSSASTQRFTVGHTGPVNITGLGNPKIQAHNTGISMVSASDWGTGGFSGGGYVFLSKSKSGSIGTYTVVAENDILGTIAFAGSDGAKPVRGAIIKAEVDGTPGTDNMPTRVVLGATKATASVPTEFIRLDSKGNIVHSDGGSGAATSAQFCWHLKNATAPAANYAAGGILYVESGQLKFRGGGGTVTTIAPS